MIYLNNAAFVASEDLHWIDETLRGNRAAFGNLVCKYQGRLFRSVILLSGSREEALDVVQDAFIQAMLKLHTFQQRSQFYTWLYRIAYHLVLKAQRLQKKQRRAYEVIEMTCRCGGERLRNAEQRPERRLEREECCRQVQQALGQLSRSQVAVVVLREIDGLGYEEIAETLSLPTGTVRSRLHRARLHLLDKLKRVSMVSRG